MFKFNFLIFLNVLGSHVTGTPYCQHSTFPRDKSQVSAVFVPLSTSGLPTGTPKTKMLLLETKGREANDPVFLLEGCPRMNHVALGASFLYL